MPQGYTFYVPGVTEGQWQYGPNTLNPTGDYISVGGRRFLSAYTLAEMQEMAAKGRVCCHPTDPDLSLDEGL